MEKKYLFGNWAIKTSMLIDEWQLSINYQKKPPKKFMDINPDWGLTVKGYSMSEAATIAIDSVWHDHGIKMAVQLAAALLALGKIPCCLMIAYDTAIIDGVWYQGMADPDTGKAGLEAWHESLKYHAVEEFNFSPKGKRLACEIVEAAIVRAKTFNKSYDAWEASWIDGPQ